MRHLVLATLDQVIGYVKAYHVFIPKLFLTSVLTYFQLDLNILEPRKIRRHYANDIFKCIYLNENVFISIKISLDFILNSQINNIPSLVQIMAWRRPSDKPLSEPMMISLLTHICVTQPQWVTQHNSVNQNTENFIDDYVIGNVVCVEFSLSHSGLNM